MFVLGKSEQFIGTHYDQPTSLSAAKYHSYIYSIFMPQFKKKKKGNNFSFTYRATKGAKFRES